MQTRRASRLNSSFLIFRFSFRSAFTLVEVILVLGVIGVLAAVAWPSVVRMQADHEMSSAAEMVRQMMSHARTNAIHSGLAYQLCYEPKGRRICVIPFEATVQVTDSTLAGNTAPPGAVKKYSGEMPKTISFAAEQVVSLSTAGTLPGQKLPDNAFAGLPEANELSSVSWSAPLIFLSEGTAQDAVVTLADRRGHRIDVHVRGLTGVAAIGAMRQERVK